jgi:hypothetical protein
MTNSTLAGRGASIEVVAFDKVLDDGILVDRLIAVGDCN